MTLSEKTEGEKISLIEEFVYQKFWKHRASDKVFKIYTTTHTFCLTKESPLGVLTSIIETPCITVIREQMLVIAIYALSESIFHCLSL